MGGKSGSAWLKSVYCFPACGLKYMRDANNNKFTNQKFIQSDLYLTPSFEGMKMLGAPLLVARGRWVGLGMIGMAVVSLVFLQRILLKIGTLNHAIRDLHQS